MSCNVSCEAGNPFFIGNFGEKKPSLHRNVFFSMISICIKQGLFQSMVSSILTKDPLDLLTFFFK